MPLISILIPVYNRADLLGDTLRSIQQQSHQEWECILVDDGSTDQSLKVIHEFAQADSRFQSVQRPVHLQKGANNCRNLALSYASGTYAIFFDSDDLMTPDHLEVKLHAIEQQQVDMLIAQTAHFTHPDSSVTFKSNRAFYLFDTYEINVFNYYDQSINWLTYDPIYKTSFIKGLQFHPDLKRGQEYYFHIQCLLRKPKVHSIDNILTLRRMHDNSIKSSFNSIQMKAYEVFQKLTVYENIPSLHREFEKHVLKDLVRSSVKSSTSLIHQRSVLNILITKDIYNAFLYVVACVLNKFGFMAYNLTSTIKRKIN
jgi:glycosyltransferase involved in cell wall biosynthesis